MLCLVNQTLGVYLYVSNLLPVFVDCGLLPNKNVMFLWLFVSVFVTFEDIHQTIESNQLLISSRSTMQSLIGDILCQ